MDRGGRGQDETDARGATRPGPDRRVRLDGRNVDGVGEAARAVSRRAGGFPYPDMAAPKRSGGDPYANVSFDEWKGVDGVVSAPGAGRDPASPFPFAIDGMSMDELVSYERRGFMTEYLKAPGFAANWARLKSEHGALEGTDVEGFKGVGTGAVRSASEPRDEF